MRQEDVAEQTKENAKSKRGMLEAKDGVHRRGES